MRRPTSSKVDTFRLGSRTRAINATHNPIPRAEMEITNISDIMLDLAAHNIPVTVGQVSLYIPKVRFNLLYHSFNDTSDENSKQFGRNDLAWFCFGIQIQFWRRYLKFPIQAYKGTTII